MIRAALFLLLAAPAAADTVVATRTIPGQTVVGAGDVALAPGAMPGGLTDLAEVIGREARVALYAGRPIRPGDIGAPAIVERNAPVTLSYRRGALIITAEGRALGRAAVGDVVRVMNTGSRSTIAGVVAADGRVVISEQP